MAACGSPWRSLAIDTNILTGCSRPREELREASRARIEPVDVCVTLTLMTQSSSKSSTENVVAVAVTACASPTKST